MGNIFAFNWGIGLPPFNTLVLRERLWNLAFSRVRAYNLIQTGTFMAHTVHRLHALPLEFQSVLRKSQKSSWVFVQTAQISSWFCDRLLHLSMLLEIYISDNPMGVAYGIQRSKRAHPSSAINVALFYNLREIYKLCKLCVRTVAALYQGAPGQMTWLEDPPPWLKPWLRPA